MKLFHVITACMLFSSFAFTGEVTGKWTTIDDGTGKEKSIVEIYKTEDGKIAGKILKIFPGPEEDPDPVCDKCTDERKDQKVIGMTIIRGLEKEDDVWSGGDILDPENGKVYSCKVWLEDDGLHVRGFLGFSLFGRSQVWKPMKD